MIAILLANDGLGLQCRIRVFHHALLRGWVCRRGDQAAFWLDRHSRSAQADLDDFNEILEITAAHNRYRFNVKQRVDEILFDGGLYHPAMRHLIGLSFITITKIIDHRLTQKVAQPVISRPGQTNLFIPVIYRAWGKPRAIFDFVNHSSTTRTLSCD